MQMIVVYTQRYFFTSTKIQDKQGEFPYLKYTSGEQKATLK